MSKPVAPCSKCKGEMKTTHLETFSGEEGGVKVTIKAMPALACAQGHRRFVYPLFAGLLMDLAFEPDTYDFAYSSVKKGLFTKRFHCPGCGKELPASPTGNKSKELSPEFKNADPFSFTVDVPVYKCEGCGKDCIHPVEEVGKLANKAVGHAYRLADIHPT